MTWKVSKDPVCGGVRIDDEGGRSVAVVTQRDPHPTMGHVVTHNEAMRRALIMGASEDLIEALSGMLEIYGVREQHMEREPFASSTEVECCNAARAAIAKARGES